MHLDDDSDSDFDGYLDETDKMHWRGGESDDNGGNVNGGHKSMDNGGDGDGNSGKSDGSSGNSDGVHMSMNSGATPLLRQLLQQS